MTTTQFIQRLSPELFWDVAVDELKADVHERFIITRVMDRGGARDARVVWAYYETSKIRSALLSAASLDAKTIAFFANQFGVRPSDFRAFHRRRALGTWGA